MPEIQIWEGQNNENYLSKFQFILEESEERSLDT